MERTSGTWLPITSSGEPYRAFLPNRLPPVPPIEVAPMLALLGDADRAVGRLDGICSTLPDPDLFLFMYVRKEAVLSSQIEGTQSSLSDLLLFEYEPTAGSPDRDAAEVSRYVAAMEHGLSRLRHDSFPLSLRLIREMHQQLMQGARGGTLSPGEFRTSQNWIGGNRPGNAAYVPPPPEHLAAQLGDFERFLHIESAQMPVLLKAALAHVQFESIHPFLDGNGRIGRLLIPFLLCAEGVLREPLLYPSLYFKQHRERYYELLQRVRVAGDWESWIEFFLAGIRETANQAVASAREILALVQEDRARLAQWGRSRLSAAQVHGAIQRHPVFTIQQVARIADLSYPSVAKAVERMQSVGMVARFRGVRRPQLFSYEKYLAILNQDTELRPR